MRYAFGKMLPAVAGLFVAATAVQAAPVSWIGPASGGAWDNGNNWSSAPNPPAAGDNAVFNSDASVDAPTNPTVAKLSGAGKFTLNSGTLTLTDGVSVNLPNGLVIGSGATLIAPGTDRSLSQVVTVNGTLDLNNNPVSWGYLSGSGTVVNALTNSQQQIVLDLGANQTQTFSGSITGKLYLDLRGGGIGNGRQVLTGTSSYTGITQIGSFGVAGEAHAELQLAGGNNRLPTGTSLYMGNSAGAAKAQLILGDSTSAISQTVSGLFSYLQSGSAVSVVGGNANVSTLDVAGGSSTWDFYGVLGGSGTNENNLALTKSGSGALNLYGINTYGGNTTVNEGTLALVDNAGLRFVIGNNGVNNTITGTGAATFNGDFTFDLTGADATPGNSWNIVDVASLNETFGATFSVIGFADNSGVWTQPIDAGRHYEFSQATGVLSVVGVPEPAGLGATLLGGLMLLRRRRARA